ncbi:MAG TPA: sodium-dependent transporter [Candidatus Acidoferrum sp.]|nr:sodium-dependent transporter [Candidatus Acidoferrum sp.]
MENERGSWGSNFGFLMAAIGSAVGLGNIWGFPYKMGKNGGFAFLIVYLLLVVFVGVVVMLGELTLGRKSGRGAVGTYVYFAKKYAWIGFMGVASGFLILAFYSVLGGMVMRYMIGYMFQLLGLDGFAGQGAGFFGYLLYDTGGLIFCYALFMVLNIIIVMGGIKGGIEKFSTVAMPALFGILLFVIVYVAFQPGAAAGYAFMFKPDFAMLGTDFFGVLKTAAGQMFFSLSLGMGCMMTYGSYLSKKEDLQKNAFIIPAADTLMAIMAGMAVMPACAAFGIDYARGPGLLFVSMQQVFANMGSFGNMMGFLFYFLVFIAALTSSISLLEVCTTYQLDRDIDKGKEPDRVKVTLGYAVVIFIIGLPVALDALGSGGATIKAPFELFNLAVKGWNDCWLDLYDMVSEGVMMPLGALLMSVLIGWVFKTKTVKEECELSGAKFRYETFFDVCFKYVVPAGMVVVLIGQLMDFFG